MNRTTMRILSLGFFISASALLWGNSEQVVTILHFENTAGHPEEQWMSRAFADGLGSRLVSPQITLVEREDLESVLKEQKLGLSGISDESTALELGKILNATQLIRGSYLVLDGRIRVSVKVIDTTSGEILFAASRESTIREYFDLEASLAWALGDFYGVTPNGMGLSASQEALQFYYKGLLSLDGKEYDLASKSFQEALILDPSFQGPRDSLEESYRFLKDFRKARYQREINVLYKRLDNLMGQASQEPFQSWGDMVSEKAMKGEDYQELTSRIQEHPELTWGSTRAEVLWHAQTVMMEIGDYAVEYFDHVQEARRMQDAVIAISMEAKNSMPDDPFLPELIYQELLAWYNRESWENVLTLCESLMIAWPDYRMMWAIEDFYERALEKNQE
jgi:TolB-like protein